MAIQRRRSRRGFAPAIRNRRGEKAVKISATEAKNKFGELLDSVLQGGMVVITRHKTPKAVLLSMNEYSAISHAAEKGFDSLNGELDALLARMQTPKARSGRKAAFAASPGRLGKAALGVKKKRGKPGRRVKLPLVRSKTRGKVHLDNAKIYETISVP